jgi:hypothetical protein
MTPLVLDNFLPQPLYERVLAAVTAAPMTYGSKSNSRTDPHGHWSWKPIHDRRQNLADLTSNLERQCAPPLPDTWDYIRNNPQAVGPPTMARWRLIRCYANGYTYGTDGYFHTDSDRADEITVILYMCDEWDWDWAGETVIREGGGYIPAPNRALIIPSNVPHCARAVSRKCTSLRTTLMFKCRKERSSEFERLSQWLVGRGALKFDHANGSLHDHLMRCYQLLEDRKCPPHVCLAGGLHSIYGTNAFPKQLIASDAANRSRVAAVCGREAEALAYMFSVLDRPKALEDSFRCVQALKVPVRLRYDQNAEITWEMLTDLRLIECANLADQGALTKWPRLKEFWG